MKAIEVTGTVDAQGKLFLDEPLGVNSPSRVRVIVLFSETDESDKDILKPAVESFRQGWKEAITGKTKPLSELWNGISDG
ncbi:MAG: hypothetical protein AB1861_10240 [Cyanobacteriota bacterium]